MTGTTSAWGELDRSGIDVPGSVSVVGYDDSTLSRLVHVNLTTVDQNPQQQAEHAVAAAVERLDSDRMLERLLSWWQGKLFVLALLGFVATDFVITITLSAADATAHVLENPFVPDLLEGHQVGVTLLLIALLGGVFLRGFTDAIGIAVDPSEFESSLYVTGEVRFGYKILRVESSVIANSIAAVLLHVRDQTGRQPHAYFGWTEGSPIVNLLRYLIFGDGEVAPLTREVLRKAEPDPARRPRVHVG